MSRRGDPDFECLKTYWYQKLKEAGFNDAENNRGYLKDWHSTRFTKDYTFEKFKEKRDYYQVASEFLFDYSFPNEFERQVWEFHVLGLSSREIAFELKEPGNTVNKDNVNQVTLKYSKMIHARMMRLDEE